MQSPTQITGNFAETLARHYLQGKKMKFIRSQFRCKLGEIDLIMQDKRETVFVEVRYRENLSFVEGFESITRRKRQCLIRTALYFQKCNPWTEHYPCRFDVISISGDQLNPKITWIPNAFGVE